MQKPATTLNQHHIITVFARLGYAARGVVYLLVGGLAALTVFELGGQTAGSRGALERVLAAPLGKVMLCAITIGLIGYAIWRVIQAAKDLDQHGTNAKGLVIRGALFVSAITHSLLALFAITLVATIEPSSNGSGGSEGVAQWLLSKPTGRWLTAIIGITVIGAGIAHAIKAWNVKFDRHFDMPKKTQYWTYPICRFGLAIRGLVFVIVGSFFIIAAYNVDPQQAADTAEVFSIVQAQSYGTWLLAIVAFGLFSFGIYSVLEAIYRRVNPAA